LVRVLHVISGFEGGGVETLIGRWQDELKQDVEFHIAAHDLAVPACAEALKQGGAVLHMIPSRKHLLGHTRALKRLLSSLCPDVVHVHTTEWGFFALRAAKATGVPVRIQHSHAARRTANPFRRIFYRVCFWLGKKAATTYLACGREAAIFAFGKRETEQGLVKLLKNGIDTDRFAFSAKARIGMRAALGIDEDTEVIGMVARFNPQKNHKAALRLFSAYRALHEKAVLLLVGDGRLMGRIKRRAAALPDGSVRFLGARNDVPALYAAMDVFILTSRFEGLPISLIEAQTSGLRALVTDRVAREAAFTELVSFLPLRDRAAWCRALALPSVRGREDFYAVANRAGYSLKGAAAELLTVYRGSSS